jgi:hypothetical protein
MINTHSLNKNECTHLNVKLGSIYLFDDYIITEFNEGVDVNFENFREVTEIINIHFGSKPFGFIANRLNSYSIDLSDSTKFNSNLPNLKAYAVVVYNSITERVFEIENHFFKYKREVFKDLENATEWVEKTLHPKA